MGAQAIAYRVEILRAHSRGEFGLHLTRLYLEAMPIVGLSNFAAMSSGDGASGKDLPPFGPGGIYHEKQIGSLCAVHCVNNMLQGPLFDYSSFQQVARELDFAEQRLAGGQSLDYGNARADGFFNVQVIETVLGRAGYRMETLGSELVRNAKADTAKETAFILNKNEHWFSLRHIGREWFDLNSCLKTPKHYTDGDVRFHISDAVKEGYSVFAVRGAFPKCTLEDDHKKLIEAVQGCGRPEQGYSLFAGGGNRLDSGSSTQSTRPAPAQQDAAAVRAARLARFAAPGGSAQASQLVQPETPSIAPSPVQVDPTPATVSQSESVPQPDVKVQTLLAMGFPKDRIACALEAANGSAEMATEILLGY